MSFRKIIRHWWSWISVPAVFDYETAEKISQEAQKAGKVHPIHLAFDTGMTRIGFRHPKESLPEILRISKLPGITIEGAFTHFAEQTNRI